MRVDDVLDTVDRARLLDELPDVVLVLDPSFRLLWANRRAEEVFERRLEDAVGTSVVERIHPDDLELTLRSFESVADKHLGAPIEVRALVGTEWRLFELIGRTVDWLGAGAVIFSLRDLTDRRRFEVSRDDVARFRSLVHYSSAIVLLVSRAGIVHSVSGALTRNLGLDPESVEHEPLEQIVVPEDWAVLQAAMDRALEGATAADPVVCSVRLRRHGSDESVAYELSLVNLLDDATVNGLIVTAHDVSARAAAESELHDTMDELRGTSSLLTATLESTADGILVIGSDRRVTSFNSQFVRMWRLDENVVNLRDDHRLLRAVQEQLKDPEGFLAQVEQLYRQPEVESDDTIEFKDGRVFQRSSKPQCVDGEVVGRVWSFSDVTTQKSLESELERMAFYDDLTGLANRALFHDHLNQALARIERSGKYVAVLYLDLDNFKTVNDSLGHPVGDDLLRAVGAQLAACLRRSDTAARLGGDEFAILVEDVDSHQEVIHLTERVMASFREPLAIGSHRVMTTASIGVTFGIAGSTSDQLLRNADLAMYRAKSQGKNRYEEFQDHMHTAVLSRLELEADLRRAVLEEQCVVHYQPIVDLAGGALVGFEALVRWLHPTRGLLTPAEFIPNAEELGIIGGIDYFVLDEACRQLDQWRDDGLASKDLFMCVNISSSEVADAAFADRVRAVLHSRGYDPTRLVLEITESSILTDAVGAVINLRGLKRLGLRIAVDDFGTGYSSFSHLGTLPVDILKIDRSFVEAGATEGEGRDLARAIVQLSETLDLRAIGEGVETEREREYLVGIGCRWAQGYHLGLPLNAVETERLLRELRDSAGPCPG